MTNGAWPKPKPKVEQLDSGTAAAPVVADAPAQPATAQPAPTQTTAAPPPPATRAPNVGPGAGVTNELTRRPTYAVHDDDRGSGTIEIEGIPYTVGAVPRPKAKGPPMAQVEAKYTVSPELGRVRDARLQQEAAQNKLTDALVAQEAKRAEVLDETADALEQESVRRSSKRRPTRSAQPRRRRGDCSAQARRLRASVRRCPSRRVPCSQPARAGQTWR